MQESTGVSLSDGSVEGDWRLPTLSELKALTSGTEAVSSTNMRAFTSVQPSVYWSSTALSAGDGFSTTSNAWYVRLDNGLRGQRQQSIGRRLCMAGS